MKQSQFTINFKTVTVNGEKVKRDNLTLNYQEFESADIAQCDADKVAVILNQSMQDYARKLITANADNWEYVPSEDDISIAAIYADITSPSQRGKRLITKQSLTAFADYYRIAAVELLGKSDKAAANGATVIVNKFVPLIGNDNATEAFESNLVNLAAHDDFDPDSQFGDMIIALVEMIQELKTPMITEDDL